jgi:hypothetical protein
MFARVNYLVRPSSKLLTRLEPYGSDSAEYRILSSPELWSRVEFDRTFMTLEEYGLQIKIAFLANLKYLYLGEGNESSAFTELLRELLGTGAIKVETFDQWWILERYDIVESLETVEELLKTNDVGGFEPTGFPNVDLWLSNLTKGTITK